MRLRPAKIIIRYVGISSRFGIRESRALLEETRIFSEKIDVAKSWDRRDCLFIFGTID
jgi:hypothetical protein